jgi:hypothetical protein
MTIDILIVFGIIVAAAAFFVWGKIRSDVVALCDQAVMAWTKKLIEQQNLY